MTASLQIGDVTIPGRVLTAPMTGVSDLPFRRIASACGAPYVATEMVACDAFARGRPDVVRRAAIGARARPQEVFQHDLRLRRMRGPHLDAQALQGLLHLFRGINHQGCFGKGLREQTLELLLLIDQRLLHEPRPSQQPKGLHTQQGPQRQA